MATKNYRYTTPVVSKKRRARQAELYRELSRLWHELCTDDIVSLAALLLAYLASRIGDL